MQKSIHPKWYDEARVTCACGNVFTIGATFPELQVEVCSKCHPFYTGQMKYVDTAGRVDAFIEKQKKAKDDFLSKKERRALKKAKKLKEELERPDSLKEVRAQSKSKKKK